ncbi:PKD domain-containing protein [Methanoregula sp.]|uniref:PKD domain-containing protein n=1 Tax=Methanoregula sp. TaxID=2052170 RepID=UPI00356AAC0F
MRSRVFLVLLILLAGIVPALALPQTPVAGFTVNPSMGPAGDPVQFTDTSTGNPVSWYWDFGDGASSTLQNPRHTYSYLGVYSVSLKVTNAAGSNTSAPKEVFMADSGTPVPTTVAAQRMTTAPSLATPTQQKPATTAKPADIPSGVIILAILSATLLAYRRR